MFLKLCIRKIKFTPLLNNEQIIKLNVRTSVRNWKGWNPLSLGSSDGMEHKHHPVAAQTPAEAWVMAASR